MKRGALFIALEGTDGSGKATQSQLLTDRLSNHGLSVVNFEFPRYGHTSAAFVELYLGNRHKAVNASVPEVVSTYYALDRAIAADEIRAALATADVVIADRFTGSNLAHQGVNIPSKRARHEFYRWLIELESVRYDIPQPDLSVVLLLEPSISAELMAGRQLQDKTRRIADYHESNHQHQLRAFENYQELCAIYPEQYKGVRCSDHDQLLAEAVIHEEVWHLVEALV